MNNVIQFEGKKHKPAQQARAIFDKRIVEELELHTNYLIELCEYIESIKPQYDYEPEFRDFHCGLARLAINTSRSVTRLKGE